MKKKLQILLAGCCALAGCHPAPKPPAADPDTAMQAAGYARAPVIRGVTAGGGGTFVIAGDARPDGRVRVQYQGSRAIGVTADSDGHFKAAVPSGGIYDVSMEDSGRLMHAEGRLFVPQDHPDKAVLLRAGASSLPLDNMAATVATFDYDNSGGAAVSGKVTPKTQVDLVMGGEIRGRAVSDDQGQYSLTTQIPPPGSGPAALAITIQAGKISANKTVPVSPSDPSGGDRTTAIDGGWRVDWLLPGGGMQSTLVY